MNNKLRYYIDGRLFEWAMTAGLIGLAFEMYVWPKLIEASAFRWVTIVIPSDVLTVAVAVVGPIRVVALLVNGGLGIIGPVARFVTAMLSCVLWSQYTYALYLLGVQNGIPSPGFPFWASFTLCEFWVCYRAVLDVKRTR